MFRSKNSRDVELKFISEAQLKLLSNEVDLNRRESMDSITELWRAINALAQHLQVEIKKTPAQPAKMVAVKKGGK